MAAGYSYMWGPLVALMVIGLLTLLLRWAFRSGGSLVERPPRPGREGEYGLLEPVAAPATYIEAEMLRRTLEDQGVRATVAVTNDGPRVMVWPSDQVRATAILTRAR